MEKLYVTFLIVMALAFFVALDTAASLQSGKTPGLFYRFSRYRTRSGPATRKGSPRRYWSYIVGNAIVLVVCFAFVVWALVSPETLNAVIRARR
jgi:formate hydrogenlyase subunit 3/multisubunit Na+/H+ antiporter MnhD subunit